jgi:hypothetical protein
MNIYDKIGLVIFVILLTATDIAMLAMIIALIWEGIKYHQPKRYGVLL